MLKPLNILIITKSFVREVTAFITYLFEVEPSVCVRAIMPSTTQISLHSQAITLRRLYWANHMRVAWFSPRLFRDIQRYRPDILHVFEEFSSLIAFQAMLSQQIGQCPGKSLAYSAENIPGNIHPLFRVPARYVMRHADLACVCSAGVIPIMRHEGYVNPIEVFPLGVDATVFHKSPNLQLKRQLGLEGKFVIGYVGRLLAMKGVDLLLDVLRELPEQIHALYVGTGPERPALEQKACAYQLAHRVHFVEYVPYLQLPQYINCMDVGIVPSRTTKRWKEQFGRVLIELMSCEVPVIGSDSGSIPEILGSTHAIFHENNREELLAMIRILINSPEKRRKVGEQGRKRVLENYSVTIMNEKMLSMYHALTYRA